MLLLHVYVTRGKINNNDITKSERIYFKKVFFNSIFTKNKYLETLSEISPGLHSKKSLCSLNFVTLPTSVVKDLTLIFHLQTLPRHYIFVLVSAGIELVFLSVAVLD